MQWFAKTILMASAALVSYAMLAVPMAMAASEPPIFIGVGQDARPPIGWVQFYNDHSS